MEAFLLPPSRVGAIIVAAGSSQRMGGVNKIFAPVAGKPLIAHTLAAFQLCDAVEQVVLVVNAEGMEAAKNLIMARAYTKVVQVCCGGARRQDSVRIGLQHLRGCDWVVVHDGARPCVEVPLIERGIQEARETGAAIAAMPIIDTVKAIGVNQIIRETIPRTHLWAAQTPQVFLYDLLQEAYQQDDAEATDEASLLERQGYAVKVYMGSYDNIKVTTPWDLVVAETILKGRAESRW